jgi:hypothetical protein
MQVFSWPKPPKMEEHSPPEIPGEFTIYGVRYSVVDGAPRMALVEERELDRRECRELIEESFGTFMELLDNPYCRDELIERIRDTHERLNQMLNAAKSEEIHSELRRVRNEHIGRRNRTIQSIKSITRAKGHD